MNTPFKALLTLTAAGLAGWGIAAFAGGVQEDLLVSYPGSYASSSGGDSNAQVIVANTVAASNAIQDQGGTGAHIHVVSFYQSAQDVAGQTTTGGIVTWLSDDDEHLADVVAYGATVGADLVCYICNNSDSASISGVSQQPGFYSSLNPSAVWSAVFAHEVGGHAYGRAHGDGVLNPKTIMLHNYCGGGAAPPYFYSNANIWFNGVQLIGNAANNCSMGALINGGDNSTPSAQPVADRRTHITSSPILNYVVHHWAFNQAAAAAPAGTVINDTLSGTAPAIIRGNGAVFTGTSVRLPGGTTGNVPMSSMAAYIDLPNHIISNLTYVTIEIWATPISAPNWARIFDFGNTAQAGDGLGATGEYTGAPGDPAPGTTNELSGIMLTAANFTDITTQRFQATISGTETLLDANLPTVVGMPHHYVATFTDGAGAYGSGGGRWQWYRDGDPVAYLDVNFHLSSIQDVNDWLGRSMYSGDSLANNDYQEVRISNVAMTSGQVLANYLLGPNYVSKTGMMNADDAAGSSSFNAAGNWSTGSAPASGNSYDTFNRTLRTPATASSYSFAGSSLTITGGDFVYNSTGSSTITVPSLTLNNANVVNGGVGTFTLAGAVSITPTGGMFRGSVNASANISGAGSLTHIEGNSVLSGNNSSFTGKTLIGTGLAGALTIDSEARLGAAPAALVSDQLALNRGTLYTTNTMVFQPTRGVLFNVDGGTIDVANGTTLTISGPISSPVTASNIVVSSLHKADGGTLVLSGAGGNFDGTVYLDSGSSSASDGAVRLASNQAFALAHSPIYMANQNTGTSTLQLDGTAAGGAITLPQTIDFCGRNNTVPAIESVSGNNTIAGVSLEVGGGNYLLQSDAGTLNFNGTLTSNASGTRTLTFQGNGNFTLSGTLQNGSATVNVIKSGTGALTVASTASNTYTGTTSLNGGTLVLTGALNSASPLTTAAGTVLMGLGSSPDSVTIGGIHAPGNPEGAQTFTGSLAYGAAAHLQWRLISNSVSTSFANRVAAGAVTVAPGAAVDLVFNGTGSNVDFSNSFWLQAQTWPVLAGSSVSGTFTLGNLSNDSLAASSVNYGVFSLAQSATGASIVYTPYTSIQKWQRSNFGGSWNNAAISGDTVVLAGDGLTNLMKYALGLGPYTQDTTGAPQLSTINGRLTLTFTRNTAATDITINVLGADNSTGPWTTLASSTGGAAFTVVTSGATATETGSGALRTVQVGDAFLTNNPSHPHRFLKVQVQH